MRLRTIALLTILPTFFAPLNCAEPDLEFEAKMKKVLEDGQKKFEAKYKVEIESFMLTEEQLREIIPKTILLKSEKK